MKVKFVIAAILLAAVFSVDAQTKPAKDKLDKKVQTAIKGFKGKVWIHAKNLDTRKEYSLRGDEQVRTASTIKTPIMAETFRQVAEGKLKWNDQLEIIPKDTTGGSGILFEFTPGTKIDLKTAVILMIVLSDNTATNLVIEKVTADAVNEYMAKLGLQDTLSMRKVGGYEAGGLSTALKEDDSLQRFGLGRSSPRDMVRLFELLEKGEVVSKEASAEMLAILKRQQYKNALGRNVASGVTVASKSGSLDRLRSDTGILYTPGGRIVIAITVDDMETITYSQDNPGLLLIWKLSEILQEGLAKSDKGKSDAETR